MMKLDNVTLYLISIIIVCIIAIIVGVKNESKERFLKMILFLLTLALGMLYIYQMKP